MHVHVRCISYHIHIHIHVLVHVRSCTYLVKTLLGSCLIISYYIISYLVMSCACPCTHVHLGIATFSRRSLWERSPKAYITIPHHFFWRHMPSYHVNLVPRRSHFHPSALWRHTPKPSMFVYKPHVLA